MTTTMQIGEKRKEIDIEAKETVMEAARRQGLYIDAPCGGRGSCGKCRVLLMRRGTALQEILACLMTGAQLINLQLRQPFDLICQKAACGGQTEKKRSACHKMRCKAGYRPRRRKTVALAQPLI